MMSADLDVGDQALLARVRRRLSDGASVATAATVAAALREEPGVHGSATVLALVDRLTTETQGAGPLESLLRLPHVTDVLVNGPASVHIDRGNGLERQDLRLGDEASVRRLAQRLAAAAGRRLDDASPWVDARMPDGTRLHAVLAPLARPGTLISLRVPASRAFSLDDLATAGSMDETAHEVVEAVIARRVAFLVTGGTGSGKTTLLGAMLGRVDPAERIVVVEDSSELRPDHPHVVGLEARPANVEGAGRVAVRDLVRQALRMRPDRLVVGEVRGAEVVEMLGALNTGHEGGCGTVHANSAADLPARIEALGVAAGLPRDAVHSQLAAAVQVVLHVARDGTGHRHLAEVGVLEPDEHHVVRCHPALTCGADGWVAGGGMDRLVSLLDLR